MKNLKILLYTIISILFISACSKDNNEIKNDPQPKVLKSGSEGYYTVYEFISDEGIIYTYYYDGVQRKISEFNPGGEGSQNIASQAVYDNNGIMIGVKINEFSTREKYYLFGDRVGRDLRKLDNFANDVTVYAESTGTIDYYERNGEIPESFTTWHNQKFNSYYPNNSKGVFTIYKEAWEPSSAWVSLTGAMVVMPPTWNNKVSRFYSLHIYGLTAFYDWSFYRHHMHTFLDFGWKTVRFIGPLSYLNDRTSSCCDIG